MELSLLEVFLLGYMTSLYHASALNMYIQIYVILNMKY
jgi:hypothetical protein